MNSIIKSQGPSQIDQLKNELRGMTQKFKSALPASMPPEKFFSVMVTAIQNSPIDLLSCDRQSLFNAAIKCAQDGLLPDGREAAFIKYGNKVQYQAMVTGIFKKIRNAGEISLIFADVVYEQDQFKIWTDENGRHFAHHPDLTNPNRGKSEGAVGAFCFARFKNGDDFDLEFMSKKEIEDVRAKSKAPNGTAWNEWWGEMAKKTVVKRQSKHLPTSNEAQQLIARDNEEHHEPMTAALSNIEQLQEKLKKFNSQSLPNQVTEPESDPVIDDGNSDPDSFENFQGEPKP